MGAIVVIADDLSGAAELAGRARNCGLSAEVQRDYQGRPDAEVAAIDTDTRGLTPEAAGQRVLAIAQRIVADQPAWIFKKVDSVLRGNVPVEIEAIMVAAGFCRALLIPCNPSRGRCIAAGRYLIDEVPLEQTAFAHDPDHPRKTSDVVELLAAAREPVAPIRPGAALSRTGISLPDVASPEDVLRRAREADEHTLLAGAADLFQAVLQVRGASGLMSPPQRPFRLAGPVLLVCGSKTAWPLRVTQCREVGVPVLTIQESSPMRAAVPALLLGIGEEPVADRVAAEWRLAEMAASAIHSLRPQTVLAEGGATAAVLARRLGWSRFDVVGPTDAGTGALWPRLPAAPLFIVKPGSYAWPATIWRAATRRRSS